MTTIKVINGKLDRDFELKTGMTIFPVIDFGTQDRRIIGSGLAEASTIIGAAKSLNSTGQIVNKIVWRNSKTEIIDNPDGSAVLIPRYDVVDNFPILLSLAIAGVIISFFGALSIREFRIAATTFADEGALGTAATGFTIFGVAALAIGGAFLIKQVKNKSA